MRCTICDGPVDPGKKLCETCRARLAAPPEHAPAAHPTETVLMPDGTPVIVPPTEMLILPDGTQVPAPPTAPEPAPTSSLEAPFQPMPATPLAADVPHVSFPGHDAPSPPPREDEEEPVSTFRWLTPLRVRWVIGICLGVVLLVILLIWHPWWHRYIPPPSQRVTPIDVEGSGQ